MENKLTKDEYKKIVIEVAIKISPLLIKKKPDSLSAAENISLYARDIADAVEFIINENYRE